MFLTVKLFNPKRTEKFVWFSVLFIDRLQNEILDIRSVTL